MADSNLDFLSTLPLFQELSLQEISILDQYLGLLELGAGDIVFDEGDSGEFVCFVVDGELEVSKKAFSGESSVITRLVKGQTIGEMALVDKLPRSATVTACSPSSLTVLSRRDFEELTVQSPEIAIKILKYLARRLSLNLRKTSNQMSDRLETNQPATA
jgi:CRP/FNR family cyclic AMP-dependent transcriptional regulator